MDDATTVIAIVTGVIAFVGGGGIVGIYQAVRKDRRDQRKEVFESFEKEIASAEKRGATERANSLRIEYEGQQKAWRAQQDLGKIAPHSISSDEEPPAAADTGVGHLEELLAASKNLSANLLSADEYRIRGNSYYQAAQYDDAVADYSRSLDLRPDDADTLMNRGVTLRNLERYDDSLADYNHALELRPDDATTLMNRGVTLRHLERYDGSLADYNHALELRPGHANTLYNRACVYSLWNKADQAVADLGRAIDGDTKYRAMARTDSDFDNIRSDPRFQELVKEETPPAEDVDGEEG